VPEALRHHAPGIASLRALLAGHAEAVEGDFAYHYNGLDYRDVFRPGGGASRLTWRRLGVLIRRLPPESATMTALRVAHPDSVTEDGPDPAEGQWSQTEMLLAALVDSVRILQWTYVSAHVDKGQRPERPQPIPRPGIERKKRKRLSDAQAEFLFRHINGIEQDPDSPIQLQVIDGGGGG
jgi:hypothetical protein